MRSSEAIVMEELCERKKCGGTVRYGHLVGTSPKRNFSIIPPNSASISIVRAFNGAEGPL